jgi:hypothetical protein
VTDHVVIFCGDVPKTMEWATVFVEANSLNVLLALIILNVDVPVVQPIVSLL